MKRKTFKVGVSLLLSSAVVFGTAFTLPQASVPTKAKQQNISGDRIYHDIAWMSNRDNARVAGTEGEHRTAAAIAKRFRKLGLDVKIQKFPFKTFISHGQELTLLSPENKTIEAKTFTYSPSTPEQGLSAEVAFAGLGKPEDFAGVDVKGKIALIQRGELTFYEKVQNAAKAGAIGAILYNNVSGALNGTLGQETDIPAIGLSDVDGKQLQELIAAGKRVSVTMKVKTEILDTYSQNVIGTLKASKKASTKKTLILGAHYDGVDTPAANDNASGTSTMLEVARALSHKKLNMNVKFIAFGAEEAGLVGSEYYVQSLQDKDKANIVGMINMDMVGVGDTFNILTASPDAKSFVADHAAKLADELKLPYERGYSTRSDHAPFEVAGIPVAFVHVSEDPYYHSDEDTLDKIQKDMLKKSGTLVVNLIKEIAGKPKQPVGKPVHGMKEIRGLKHELPAVK
ncbi:M28 family peptidase [Laceyella tengchongensis]|jgi:aminopeptidase YwaD